MVKIVEKEFKTALNKLKYPDSLFWARYTINPYSGCEHACVYCDARSNRYYLSHDFENEVVVKIDIDKKLEERLNKSKSLLIDVVGPGGVSDAYQPIEQKVCNTLKILQVLKQHKFPINIATKSRLITRDYELLRSIANDTWCTIGFSITTIDEDLARFLEPYSSPPKERLEAIKFLKERASEITVGTYMIPIIPFLEDSEENLEGIIKASKQAKADFVAFYPGMTIRDNDVQGEFFYRKLRESQYRYAYEPLSKLFKKGVNSKEFREYYNRINLLLYNLCKEYKVDIRVKRWIPKDFRKWNYIASEALLDKDYKDSVTTGKSNRSFLWAGLNLNNLSESIIDIYRAGALGSLKNFNKSVIYFIEPILKEGLKDRKKSTLDRFL